MIVVDASVVTAAVSEDDERSRRIRERLAGQRLSAPEIIDLEVVSAIRRGRRSRRLGAERAVEALTDLAFLPISRVSHTLLLDRIWRLRDNLTAYDASYVALAQVLGAPLFTGDARLSGAPGLGCEVVLVA